MATTIAKIMIEEKKRTLIVMWRGPCAAAIA